LTFACQFSAGGVANVKSAPLEARRPMTDPKNQGDGDNRRGAVAGLVIAIVLLAVGIWLARDLSTASKMQDCLMSGRTNCNTIEPAR
jgi:hypothetical protein